jgi:hypothetical protein
LWQTWFLWQKPGGKASVFHKQKWWQRRAFLWQEFIYICKSLKVIIRKLTQNVIFFLLLENLINGESKKVGQIKTCNLYVRVFDSNRKPFSE